jgi:hypothetical protein
VVDHVLVDNGTHMITMSNSGYTSSVFFVVLIFIRCVHVYLYGMSVHGLHLDAVIQKKIVFLNY